MALTIEIFPDGTAELGIDSPEMDAADRMELGTIIAAFGHLLPAGEYSLSDWARHIEGAHPESVVAGAYAGRLREIERHYTLPLPGLDCVIEHGPNTVGRDWVAGDIHGQYGKFMRALEAVGFDVERDRLFQVGDLIDRGRNSRQCLELAFEPWFYGCLGNHERLALDALREGQDSGAWDLWFRNGGSWIYGEDIREVKTLLEAALPHLPLAREVQVAGKRIGIVHAEPPPHWTVMKANPEIYLNRMTWGRTRLKKRDTTPVEGIDVVVAGHTILDAPRWLGNVHFIDTGAFLNQGRLTLLPLDALSPPDPEITS